MNTATIKFEAFESLKNEDCQQRILKAKKTLGNEIIILGHHYQNEEHIWFPFEFLNNCIK